MEKTRFIVITAVAVLCISVIMSAYFTRSHQQKMKKLAEEALQNVPGGKHGIPNPRRQAQQPRKTSTSKQGGWASVILPFYSLGIFGYMFYVIGKIMSVKYSNARKNQQIKLDWRGVGKSKGKTKPKITQHELQQLEHKLQETEEAVQQIFDRGCRAVKAAVEACESCSSDEEYTTWSITRFKPTQNAETTLSEDQPRSTSKNVSLKTSDNDLDYHAFPQRRKMRETGRRFKREYGHLHSLTSSSDSERENASSCVCEDGSGSRCALALEKDFVPEADGYRDSGTLVQTAKNIHSKTSG